MTWTRAASEPELGPSGGSGRAGRHTRSWARHQWKAPDGSGAAPGCLVPVGKLTLARKNQEEAQMTHCPTSSKVKTQQCVWPLGLDVIAALAPSAAKIKAVGQQPRRSLGLQPRDLSHCPLPHTSLHGKFLNTVCNFQF